MSTRQGICTNLGNCGAANKQQPIRLPADAPFVCPQCGLALTPSEGVPAQRSPLRDWGLPLAIAVLVPLALAGLFFLGKGFHGISDPHPKPVLTLSGSNTIGADLGPALAEAFLKREGATGVHIGPGDKADEKFIDGTLPGDSKPSRIRVAAHGSATAFTDMQAGVADIGMSSRSIKPEEASKLSSLGDMYSLASEHVLGLDGIAVIVNASNPVSSLTKDQLLHLFSGDYTNWSQVGGSDAPVNIYARDDKSGTYDTFKNKVLGSHLLVTGARRFEDSNQLSEAVAADPSGIGFVGLPYIHSARALAIADKGARTLLPSRLTVGTEDYPLSRRLYLYTAAVPSNSLARSFVEFALSRSGQDVVKDQSFVELTVTSQRENVASNAPAGYRELTQHALRLTTDFRFRSGKTDLDNRAIKDVDRVLTFITDLHYPGNKIMLFGFADNVGARDKNISLSLDRALAVQKQFVQRGLDPALVRGFGPDSPVASNETDDGRQLNRRVEIWVKQ